MARQAYPQVASGPVIEQDWQNECTRYWFVVEIDEEPQDYCLADTNGETQILDHEGYPLTPGDWLELQLKRVLIPLYERARDESKP